MQTDHLSARQEEKKKALHDSATMGARVLLEDLGRDVPISHDLLEPYADAIMDALLPHLTGPLFSAIPAAAALPSRGREHQR